MFIDTHAHVNFKAYKEDGDEVIQRALNHHIWMVNVGSQYSTSKRAVEYAQKYPKGVYAAIGLHPLHLEDVKVDALEGGGFESRKEILDIEKYRALARNQNVVALGEIGLDYYHINDEKWVIVRPLHNTQERDAKQLLTEVKNNQKEIFKEQLRLAAEIQKPVIIHCREAYDDALEILQQITQDYSELRGVIHSFGGTLEQAKQYINLGFFVSFNGLITFARTWDHIVREIDLSNIMVETDCPYLTPVPLRGKRNEPLYVKYVAEKMAELKGITLKEVARQTTKNAKQLFGIA